MLNTSSLPISVQLGACYNSGKGTNLCYFNMSHSLCCLHLPVHHLPMVAIHFSSDLPYFFQMLSVLKVSLFFFPRVNSVELVKKEMRGRESVPAGFWKGIFLFQLANHNSGSIFNTMSMPNFSFNAWGTWNPCVLGNLPVYLPSSLDVKNRILKFQCLLQFLTKIVPPYNMDALWKELHKIMTEWFLDSLLSVSYKLNSNVNILF